MYQYDSTCHHAWPQLRNAYWCSSLQVWVSALTVFQSRNEQKVYPVPDRNADFLDPVSDSEAKTIPCWAAHSRIAHIWEYPPSPQVSECPYLGFHFMEHFIVRSQGNSFIPPCDRFPVSTNEADDQIPDTSMKKGAQALFTILNNRP